MYKSDSFLSFAERVGYEFDKMIADGILVETANGILAPAAPVDPAPRSEGARRPHLKGHAKSVKDKATLGARRRRDPYDLRDYYPNDPSSLLVGDESYVTHREGLLAKRELLVAKLCAKRAEIADLNHRAEALLREGQNIAAQFTDYAKMVCNPTYHPMGWEEAYVSRLCEKRDRVSDLLTARAEELEKVLADKRRLEREIADVNARLAELVF